MPFVIQMMSFLFVIFTSLDLSSAEFYSRGHWLLDSFQFDADCLENPNSTKYIDHEFWQNAHSFLSNRTSNEISDSVVKGLNILSRTLMPLGVVDPTVALQCPLGTSALLQALASDLAELSPPLFWRRSMRMLHLSKLFLLHKYSDLGEGVDRSRWPVSNIEWLNLYVPLWTFEQNITEIPLIKNIPENPELTGKVAFVS